MSAPAVRSPANTAEGLLVPPSEGDQRMRMRRPARNIVTEIQLETRIPLHVIAEYIDDMHLHVTLRIDHPAGNQILHQEVVGHQEPFAIVRQMQVMRSRIQTEV